MSYPGYFSSLNLIIQVTGNPILHVVVDQRIFHGERGQKCPYLTPEPKVMEHEIWHTSWTRYSAKVFRKIGFESFSKINVIFAMRSQAVQILYKGLFFNTELYNAQVKLATSQKRLMMSF